MVSFTYIIKDKFGIHARPGLLLVQEAGKLTSNITIFKGTDSGDAKRMFCVMNLDSYAIIFNKENWSNESIRR